MDARQWAAAVDELGRSRLYPENLGTGAPFEPDVRLQDYLEAACRDRMGDPARAAELRRAVRDYTLKNLDDRGPNAYIGGLVLERLGETGRARELLRTAQQPEPEILEAVKRYGR